MYIYATTPGDDRLDRDAPDITDLVTKALLRYNNTPEDERDIDALIETETEAVAIALRVVLQPHRAKQLLGRP